MFSLIINAVLCVAEVSQQQQAHVDAESVRLPIAARLIEAETVVLVQPGPHKTSSQLPRQKEDKCQGAKISKSVAAKSRNTADLFPFSKLCVFDSLLLSFSPLSFFPFFTSLTAGSDGIRIGGGWGGGRGWWVMGGEGSALRGKTY